MNLEKRIVKWVDLGLTDYKELDNIQKILAAKRELDQIGDIILVTEHFPVINFGSAPYHNKFSRGLIEKVGSADENKIAKFLNGIGINFVKSSRGGGSTYIAPGQLIFYPIVKYEDIVGRHFGIGEYKSLIDKTMLSALGRFGINAEIFEVVKKIGEGQNESEEQRRDRKDIWVTKNGKYYKVGGKGIKISGGVAYYGFNFYMTDESLTGFDYIDPCGYTKEELGVKSVEAIHGEKISRNSFRDIVLKEVMERFGYFAMQEMELKNFSRTVLLSREAAA
jgi:lipoyl(octanoyl) transferase